MHHAIQPLPLVSNFALLIFIKSLESVNTSSGVLAVLPVAVIPSEPSFKNLNSESVCLSVLETADIHALDAGVLLQVDAQALAAWLSPHDLALVEHAVGHLDHALGIVVEEQGHSLQHVFRALEVLAVESEHVFLGGSHLRLVLGVHHSFVRTGLLLLLHRVHRLVRVVVGHRATS